MCEAAANYYEEVFKEPSNIYHLHPYTDAPGVIWENYDEKIPPMCFITIELRRSYGVTAIALWPVITKNCDAVTHNYEKKIVVTRSYDTKIVAMRKYVTVFLIIGSSSNANLVQLRRIILCH